MFAIALAAGCQTDFAVDSPATVLAPEIPRNAFETLNALKPPCPTGPDVAQAVRMGRADCGIATRAVALTAGLDFIPLTWEHFDLALRQRDYFLPGPQALADFLRTSAFRERAAELKGYDVAATGSVRHIN